jgi:hypothetical protein
MEMRNPGDTQKRPPISAFLLWMVRHIALLLDDRYQRRRALVAVGSIHPLKRSLAGAEP